MKKRVEHTSFFILLLFLLSSCGRNHIINESQSLEHPWRSNQTIDFEFEITDTISPYTFYVNVRNNTDYNYSNIYFFINTVFPDGRSSRDTVECILANVRGKWLGKGIGSLKESTHLIRENLKFPVSGLYKMEFEQAMREDELDGIKDVGVKIVKKTK